MPQRPRPTTGAPERRLPLGNLVIGKPQRRPVGRPTARQSTTTRTQRRAEHLDRLLVASQKVTAAINGAANPTARRHLVAASNSLSRAINVRFRQVTARSTNTKSRDVLLRDLTALRRRK